jgi:hypothetical protein
VNRLPNGDFASPVWANSSRFISSMTRYWLIRQFSAVQNQQAVVTGLLYEIQEYRNSLNGISHFANESVSFRFWQFFHHDSPKSYESLENSVRSRCGLSLRSSSTRHAAVVPSENVTIIPSGFSRSKVSIRIASSIRTTLDPHCPRCPSHFAHYKMIHPQPSGDQLQRENQSDSAGGPICKCGYNHFTAGIAASRAKSIVRLQRQLCCGRVVGHPNRTPVGARQGSWDSRKQGWGRVAGQPPSQTLD